MRPIRVLHICHGMETFGGVESFLLQYYEHMNRNEILFDFLFCCNNTLAGKESLSYLNESKIYEIGYLDVGNNSIFNYIRVVQAINNILDIADYDIIHINTSNVLLQFFCAVFVHKKGIRIAHSHSTVPKFANPSIKDSVKETIKNTISPFLKKVIVKNSDYLFACSNNAGLALFGKQGIKSEKFKIIKNAIDVKKYLYDKQVRQKIRLDENVENNIVIGTVGRLAESKNLLFLIDIFYELHEMNSDVILWLIGEGPMRSKIEKKISEYNLDKFVKLLGEKNNINQYLQGMDCFVFPTVYEGLGIVAIEAQAAGLPTIVSDAVPREANITDLFIQVSLKANAKDWANTINKCCMQRKNRKIMFLELENSGYEIEKASERLSEIYKGMVGLSR